jgi:hypothetical protein
MRRLRVRQAMEFMTRDPHWKRKLLIGGLWFFPLPPLGWIMALGFRSLTGPRLVEGHEPVLPEWRGNLMLIAKRGAIAVLVIVAHFSPFLFCYWWFGLDSLREMRVYWLEALSFMGAIAAFPPLFLTTLPVTYAFAFSWLSFSLVEVAILTLLFVGAFFILPASFVQVGRYGDYASAFKARSAWRFALVNWSLYLEAWIISLIVSGIAVFMGPFMPWGLFWSYLVILHVFLDALSQSNTRGVRERFMHSTLLRTFSDRESTGD